MKQFVDLIAYVQSNLVYLYCERVGKTRDAKYSFPNWLMLEAFSPMSGTIAVYALIPVGFHHIAGAAQSIMAERRPLVPDHVLLFSLSFTK